MRWIALAIVLLTPGAASARMVRRRDPPVVEACRERKDWAAVTACLGKLGTYTVDRTVGRARLVHVRLRSADEPLLEDAGFYLFVQSADGTWHIGGMYSASGSEAYIRGLAEITVARRTMYRIDVGSLQRTPLTIDGAPPVSVTIHRQASLYCYGVSYGCVDLPTTCEVMTRGKTLFSFHGTLRLSGQDVIVEGDERNAGSICTASRTIALD